MVFAGMLPWTFFASGLSDASNSLISNANLISKVYFPRMIVPGATVVVALVDFLISFCIMLVLMVWYQFLPGWQMLLLPVFMSAGILSEPRTLPVDHRPYRQVSGLSLHNSIHCSIWIVHFTGRFQLQRCSRTVAVGLWP